MITILPGHLLMDGPFESLFLFDSADFGVAASINETMCKRKSFTGTPYSMVPEVAAVERKGGYNHLCDI
ncbi:unnamed protein product [Rotaria sordida]|uniref:Protein kinase domain-containing protein n=1 Tax=Rotaria sordida TaxID=392033 RepID=A0A816FBS7_9BILA|nr:unnamed protein product [Rotaria sordida]CAF1510977.1 unnamed protein product [Rotaria sordida]CAF1658473.1 unnamed protein product [Rotaria sordida]CAF1658558.1 unnamed protein product [Rotaria sordida]